MDIWQPPSITPNQLGHYHKVIPQLQNANRSMFIYSDQSQQELHEVWETFSKHFRKKRSLLANNCAKSTAKMIETIFDLQLEPFHGCSRLTLCAWIPNSKSPIPLPEGVFTQITKTISQTDIPHHISTSREKPFETLQKLLELNLKVQRPMNPVRS